MQSSADECVDGFDKPREQQTPRSKASAVSPRQRGKLDEALFCDDPRRQYAALKELESTPAISKSRYDRVREIRWATRHLALAELAEKILQEKKSSDPGSTDTHQEILKLIRQCERRQLDRLVKAMREDPLIAFPRETLVRWLECALLAGVVLGAGLAFLFAPQGRTTDAMPAEAYIDIRTGELVAAEAASAQRPGGSPKDEHCQPAYYCWKCRQWLPVRNMQNQGTARTGPLRAASDRPNMSSQKNPQ
jgi:hypothetical protein